MMVKALAAILALTLAAVIATRWQAARAEAAAEATHPPDGNFVEIAPEAIGLPSGAAIRVHYLTEGSGPDLILIHGASGSTRDFTFSLMPQLTDRFRVTAFDRPGLGYTDRLGPDGASIADQARLLAAASEALGIEAPVILGQSYGGAVALAWALEHDDVAALVLISAASNPWTTGIGAYYTALSSRPGQAIMAPLLTAWVPQRAIDTTLDFVFAPQAAPDGYADYLGPRLSLRRDTLRENALQRAHLLDEISAQVVHYPELTLPVEIVHGTADTIVPAHVHSEPLSRQIPSASLTLLDGIGHMPQHAAEAEVIAAIERAAARAGLR